MVVRPAVYILLVLLWLAGGASYAQPTLPGIAGSADKGLVLLSWNCQYTGIKSITVLHSVDSVRNFATIGTVKNTSNGVQAFIDAHPSGGRNYYKLNIVFSSGLAWKSNRCMVQVDPLQVLELVHALPPNDSLQRFVSAPASADNTKQNNAATTDTGTRSSTNNVLIRHVLLSFETDSAGADAYVTKDHVPPQAPLRKRIVLSFTQSVEDESPMLRSRFINADVQTGHINVVLPDDVSTHHYTVKFYDEEGHVIIDVPGINAQRVIIDKRNFQSKSIYRFVLLEDSVELEAGYVKVN